VNPTRFGRELLDVGDGYKRIRWVQGGALFESDIHVSRLVPALPEQCARISNQVTVLMRGSNQFETDSAGRERGLRAFEGDASRRTNANRNNASRRTNASRRNNANRNNASRRTNASRRNNANRNNVSRRNNANSRVLRRIRNL